ncbi:hypothetical protein ABW21_db0208436 [Orbilia brochopaga]|nr:hypothetical protein ABW21_db0208436 [Drechslerella brochopaga]
MTTDRLFVTSSSVANASPTWRRFISPKDPSLQIAREKAVILHDMKSLPRAILLYTGIPARDAFLTLFKIMHLKMKEVPNDLTFDELYELAATCNEYSCADLVHPWSHDWVNILLDDENHDAYTVGYEGWLLIGTVLPSTPELDRLTFQLSVHLAETCFNCKFGSFSRWKAARRLSDRIKFDLHDSKLIFTSMIPAPIVGEQKPYSLSFLSSLPAHMLM